MNKQKIQPRATNVVQPDQRPPRNGLRDLLIALHDLLVELDRRARLDVKIDGRQFTITANGIAAVVLAATILAWML